MNATVLSSPTLNRQIEGTFEVVYERVRIALKAAGFAIMADIDLAEFLAKKSQSYMRPYKIIVVCNSEIAHRALTMAPDVGVVLPYHIAVLETQDNQTEVRIADPHITWNTAAQDYLRPVADDLNMRLERVVTALNE